MLGLQFVVKLRIVASSHGHFDMACVDAETRGEEAQVKKHKCHGTGSLSFWRFRTDDQTPTDFGALHLRPAELTAIDPACASKKILCLLCSILELSIPASVIQATVMRNQGTSQLECV